MNAFINTAKVKSDAKGILKGNYGGAVVVILAYFTATSLFAYLQTLIQVIFGMVDLETGTLILDFDSGMPTRFIIGAAVLLLCTVGNFLFTAPLSVGLSRYFFNFASGKNPRVEEIFSYLSSFKMYGKALSLNIRLAFLQIMWGLLLIFPALALYAYGLYSSDIDLSLLLSGETVNITDTTALLIMSAGSILLIIGSCSYTFITARYFLASYILAFDDEVSARTAITVSVSMIKGRVWQYFALILSFIGWILLSILTCGILLLFTLPYMYVTFALYAKAVIDVNLNPPQFLFNS